MASVFYPALTDTSSPKGPYTAAVSTRVGHRVGAYLGHANLGWRINRYTCNSVLDAPFLDATLPVVVLSPGFGVPRSLLTGLAEWLASHRYVVVAVDHSYDAPAVEFPDGHITWGHPVDSQDADDMAQVLRARVEDIRLVLDRLAEPWPIGPALDTSAVAMVGHSYGGLTALTVAYEDPRVKTVAVLDGTAGWLNVSPVSDKGLTIPVLSISAQPGATGGAGVDHPSWQTFRDSTKGGFRELWIEGAAHYAFTDLPFMLTDSWLTGPIMAERAREIVCTYVQSWCEETLRHHEAAALHEPTSGLFPEVHVSEPNR